ncbi:MAG TPA: DNA-processing protein DprA [Sandaracinaceae bacterium]
MSTAIRAISETADDYPARLRDLRDAPKGIWVRGTLPPGPYVAVVGTRRATPEAEAFTERLAGELARGGATIVSGGADGIDAAAHRGALLAQGRTIVVQPAALDRPYPRSNAALFARVLDGGGAWLSETPLGRRPERWRFLARNRIIAALADVVVVVQAPIRSGALSTARFARTLGRVLYAVPGAPWDPRADGTNLLLVQGARLCRDAADVALALGVPAATEPRPRGVDGGLPPDPQAVLRALAEGPAHVDVLVSRTGLSAARVQAALVELSMAGLARRDTSRWRAARP